MTPAELDLAIQGVELLVSLISKAIAAGQATDAARAAQLDDLEGRLLDSVVRLRSLKHVPLPPSSP